MFFSDRFGHKFEKAMAVGGDQRIVKVPVHFKLAVGILVVVLVRAPTHIQHIVTDFADHFIAPHHCLLIIARLGRCIEGIGDLVAFGG